MARHSSQERKRAKIQLVIGIIGTLGIIGFLVYQMRWIRTAISGPVTMSMEELSKVEDPEKLDNPWVTLTFDDVKDTGLGYEKKGGSDSGPKSKFYLVAVSDRWLIAELPHDHSGNTATGHLEEWTNPLPKEAVGKIKSNFPQYADKILPYQFDAEYGYRSQCYSMLGVMGFFLLVTLGLAIAGLVSLRKFS